MTAIASAITTLVAVGEQFNTLFCKPYGSCGAVTFGGSIGHDRTTFGRCVLSLLTRSDDDLGYMRQTEGEGRCVGTLAWLRKHYEPAYNAVLAALPQVDKQTVIADQWFACAERYRAVRDAAETLVTAGTLGARDATEIVDAFGVEPTPLSRMKSFCHYFSGIDNRGTAWEHPSSGPSRPSGWRPVTDEDNANWVCIGGRENSNNSTSSTPPGESWGHSCPSCLPPHPGSTALGHRPVCCHQALRRPHREPVELDGHRQGSGRGRARVGGDVEPPPTRYATATAGRLCPAFRVSAAVRPWTILAAGAPSRQRRGGMSA